VEHQKSKSCVSILDHLGLCDDILQFDLIIEEYQCYKVVLILKMVLKVDQSGEGVVYFQFLLELVVVMIV
jgi:hypothetical protein